MKKILLILTSLILSPTYSATMEVYGPCLDTPLFQGELDIPRGTNAGKFTVDIFNTNNVHFQGNEKGMNSIYNSPIGLDAFEVISDTEMYAYGWCYSINGVEPADFINKFPITNDDIVKWWYGYAHYLNGDWISQCEISHRRKPEQFCSK